MKEEYLQKIIELLDKTNDIQLLDFVFQILNKSTGNENINPQTHTASA